MSREHVPRNIGLFAVCKGVYDESGNYKANTESNIIKCCMRLGTESLKICREQCNTNFGKKSDLRMTRSYDRCMSGCDNMLKQTIRMCGLSGINDSWGSYGNPYIKCAKKFDCNKDKNDTNKLSPDCLKKHRDEIHNCCRKGFLPTFETDPEKHCDLSYRATAIDFLPDEQEFKDNIPYNIKSVDDIKKYNVLKNRDSCINQYVIGVAIVCFLVVLAYVLTMYV